MEKIKFSEFEVLKKNRRKKDKLMLTKKNIFLFIDFLNYIEEKNQVINLEKNNDFDDIFDMVKKMFENIISQNPNMDFKIDIKRSDDIAVPEEISPKDSKTPYSEVIEEKENIMVIVELPGINKEEINLEAGKDDLQISIPNQGPFIIELPCAVQSDHIKAHLTNGILEIELKKSEELGKKQILLK